MQIATSSGPARADLAGPNGSGPPSFLLALTHGASGTGRRARSAGRPGRRPSGRWRGGASVLVVNGDKDPFGIPAPNEAIRVVVLKGESHSLSRNPAAVAGAVAGWLSDVRPLVC